MQYIQHAQTSKRRFWITGVILSILSIGLLICISLMGFLLFEEINILENGIQISDQFVDANIRVLSQVQRELLKLEIQLVAGENDPHILGLQRAFVAQRMNEAILPYQLQTLGSEDLLNKAREYNEQWDTQVEPIVREIIADPEDIDQALRTAVINKTSELELGFNELVSLSEINRKLLAGEINDGAKEFLATTRFFLVGLGFVIVGYLAFIVITALSYVRFDRERETATQELIYLTHEMRKLSLVARLTNNLVIISDPHGHVEWVNDSFIEQTGYSLDEVKGKTPGSILQGENTNPKTNEFMREQLHQGKGFSTEIVNYRKSGEEYWISIEVQPSYDQDGKLLNFIAVETDITERKQRQARLQHYAEELETANQSLSTQQRRLRSLLDIATQSNNTQEQLMQAVQQGAQSLNMEIGIISHIQGINYEIVQCYAPTHDLQIGMTCDVNATLCVKTVGSPTVYSVHNVQSIMDIKEPCFDSVMPSAYIGVPIRIGEKIYGTLSFISEVHRETPFTESDHDFVDLMAQWVNVTLERTQIEEGLRKNLERERELGQLRSRFITMASHEFRTPLTTIMSIASFLEMAEEKISSEKRLDRLGKIQTAVGDMTQLLNDVLLLGKAEADRLEFQPKLIDIQAFTTEIVEDIQAGWGKTHQINQIDKFESKLFADEKLMRQVITNLVTNAIKYSPADSPILLELGLEDEQFYLIVEDKGIGIPDSDQKHLFEAFHRSKNVGEIPGTGLGLAIIKKAVEIHNGTISFESVADQGTCFKVMIPIRKEA